MWTPLAELPNLGSGSRGRGSAIQGHFQYLRLEFHQAKCVRNGAKMFSFARSGMVRGGRHWSLEGTSICPECGGAMSRLRALEDVWGSETEQRCEDIRNFVGYIQLTSIQLTIPSPWFLIMRF